MKVSFDLAKNQVAIEGDGADLIKVLELVREIAPRVSEIKLITGSTNNGAVNPAKPEASGFDGNGEKQRQGGAPGMREFARSISPTNNYERIVGIAAYKARYESCDLFAPKEMAEWFVMCGFEKPVQMAVALFDAKRKYGYLDKAGHGKWKLSTGGLNLVTRRVEGSGGGQ